MGQRQESKDAQLSVVPGNLGETAQLAADRERLWNELEQCFPRDLMGRELRCGASRVEFNPGDWH